MGLTLFIPLILQHNITIAPAITRAHLTESFERKDEQNPNSREQTNLLSLLSLPENKRALDMIYDRNPGLRDCQSAAPTQTLFNSAAAAISSTTSPTTDIDYEAFRALNSLGKGNFGW